VHRRHPVTTARNASDCASALAAPGRRSRRTWRRATSASGVATCNRAVDGRLVCSGWRRARFTVIHKLPRSPDSRGAGRMVDTDESDEFRTRFRFQETHLRHSCSQGALSRSVEEAMAGYSYVARERLAWIGGEQSKHCARGSPGRSARSREIAVIAERHRQGSTDRDASLRRMRSMSSSGDFEFRHGAGVARAGARGASIRRAAP